MKAKELENEALSFVKVGSKKGVVNKSNDYVYNNRVIPKELKPYISGKFLPSYVCGKTKKDVVDYHKAVERAIIMADGLDYKNATDEDRYYMRALIFNTLKISDKIKKKHGLLDSDGFKPSLAPKALTTNNLKKDIERWLKLYEEKLEDNNKSKNTYIAYEKKINSFIDYISTNKKNLNIQNITHEHISDYIRYRKDTSTRFGAYTQKQYVIALSVFFKWVSDTNTDRKFFKNKDEEGNYLNDIKVPKREREAFTKKEQEDILTALSLYEDNTDTQKFIGIRNSFFIKLMLFGGLRVSEVSNLKLDNFSLIEYEDEYFYKISFIGKGDKERISLIKVDRIKEEFKFLKKIGVTYAVESINGKPLDRKNLWNISAKIIKSAGIDKTGNHIFRHSFAKNLVADNINLSKISKLLGHSNIKTTMIYAESNEIDLIEAIK